MPFYAIRSLGGLLFLAGAFIMIWNLMKTAKTGNFLANEPAEAPALARHAQVEGKEHWHRVIERKPVQMLVLSLVLVGIGGLIEMIPTFMVKTNIPTIEAVKPYTALELQGRDIYIREGCYTCHSQMIRPFRSETERYGEYSKAGEFVYDHPFQWGSKRTGPDLAREGADKLRRMDSWHYNHMMDPTSMSPGSIMPAYPWLFKDKIDLSSTTPKLKAMVTLGVPYSEEYVTNGEEELKKQAKEIYQILKVDEDKLLTGEEGLREDHEIIALIAYLQRLGKDITTQPQTASK
jgi:cytochrome c oxidase cbb3-type subunit I/II